MASIVRGAKLLMFRPATAIYQPIFLGKCISPKRKNLRISRGQAYRPDIDGLRAIAVVSVIFYHASIPGFAGGYTGVDTFFVISGFLITSLLMKEIQTTGSLDILNFFSRRIRRIFPSIILLSVFTLVFSLIFLSTVLSEITDISKSVIATMLFVSNFYFLDATSGYFAPNAHEIPLLHTWSLSIEEQYYLTWPLILLAIYKYAGQNTGYRNRFIQFSSILVIASVIVSAFFSRIDENLAFFLPFSRFWELGAGSLLAFVMHREGDNAARQKIRGGASVTGVILLVGGFVAMTDGSGKFPFPLALVPVIGTAMIIWGNQAAKVSPVKQVLSTTPFVFVGRISYAWYLWHWPLLSFAYILTLGQVSSTSRLGLVFLSFLIASLTTVLFEEPIRFGKLGSAKRIVGVGVSGALSVALIATASYLAAKQGWIEGDERIARAFLDRPPRQRTCLLGIGTGNDEQFPAACLASDPENSLVIWGDSYADQWEPTLSSIAEGRGMAVTQLTKVACPPLIGATPPKFNGKRSLPYHECKTFNDKVVHLLEDAARRPPVVVMAANWADHAMPGSLQTFDIGDGSIEESLKSLERYLDLTLSRLARQDLTILLVLQSPKPGRSIPACVMRLGADACDLSKYEQMKRAEGVNASLKAVASKRDNIALVDPAEILCRTDVCPSTMGDLIVYYDDLHVSTSFARSADSVNLFVRALAGFFDEKTTASR